MSEISKTAGVVETSQDKPSLLEKARGILTKPVGKFIGGAMIVGAVTGATRDAAADTIACVVHQGGSVPLLVTDSIGNTEKDKIDDPYVSGFYTTSSPIVSRNNIFCEGYGANYIGFDTSLIHTTGLDIPKPKDSITNIIGENGISISPGDPAQLYRLNLGENSFDYLGESPSGYEREIYGGYMFVQGQDQNNSSIQVLRVVSEEAILNENLQNFHEWKINQESRPSSVSGFAIDKSLGQEKIVMGVFKNSQNGYVTIPLQFEGDLLSEDTWAQDYPTNGVEFIPTNFEIHKIYVDSNGDRYFITRNGKASTIHIQPAGGSLIEDTFTLNIKILTGTSIGVTVLPSGGLYIVEEGATTPKILKFDGSDYTLTTAPDFPGAGTFGTIQGCNTIDPKWEPTDPNPEPIPDEGDFSEDVIQDKDVYEDTGSDEGGDEGIDTGSDEGGDEGMDTGSDEGGDEGIDTGSDEGGDEGIDTGSDEGGDEGMDTNGTDEGMDVNGTDSNGTDTNPGRDLEDDSNQTDNSSQYDTVDPQDVYEPDAFAEGDGGGGSGCNTSGKGSPEGMIPVTVIGLALIMRKRFEEWGKLALQAMSNNPKNRRE